MKTLNELLGLASQGKLDEIDTLAAEVQGFEFAPIRYSGIGEDTTWQDNNKSLVSKYYPTLDYVGDYWIDHVNEKLYEDDYHPTRDKAQAVDLMLKAKLKTTILDKTSLVVYGNKLLMGRMPCELWVEHEDFLIAVTIAFILAKQGDNDD